MMSEISFASVSEVQAEIGRLTHCDASISVMSRGEGILSFSAPLPVKQGCMCGGVA